jgi:putative hemolysin
MSDEATPGRRRPRARGLAHAAAVAILLGVAGGSAAVAQTRIANPASQNCVAAGGTPSLEQRPDGGQFGVCVFVDNHQCEEWALFRGECPAGGLRVTGYLTRAARYCAITGGRFEAARNDCLLPGGRRCDVEAYWAGTCSRQ